MSNNTVKNLKRFHDEVLYFFHNERLFQLKDGNSGEIHSIHHIEINSSQFSSFEVKEIINAGCIISRKTVMILALLPENYN